MSARGLAIDTVGGGKGEEFPRFTEFWIVRPDADAKSLTVYALLDSPSVAGAFLLSVLGSLYPAWRAVSMTPADALRRA